MTAHETIRHAAAATPKERASGIRPKVLSPHVLREARNAAKRPTLTDVTALMTASLDPFTALRELTRIVRDWHGCGCVVDIVDADPPLRIASLPPTLTARSDGRMLDPLVAEVVARGRVVFAPNETLHDPRGRSAIERVRSALAVPWVVCAPLKVNSGEAIGTLTLFAADETTMFVGAEMATEVAARIAAALEVARSHQEALRAVREREQVLAVVAHELKNPLGIIMMGTAQALEVAVEAEAQGCSHARRELEAIQRSAKRMKKLVADLLDLASVDAGTLSMKPVACDVNDVIRTAVREIGPSSALVGIQVVEDLPSRRAMAWADGDRIVQVLINLISNAIKFTPRGGRVRVRAALVDDTEIVVAVEDSGSGMAPDQLSHAFERFWQAPDTAKLGSGLGLPICKSIVELAGGRIWPESTVGVGTTIYFTLPALV